MPDGAMLVGIHNEAELTELFRSRKLDPQQLRLLRRKFLRRFLTWGESLTAISAEARDVCVAKVAPHALELDERFDSQLDGASRFVLRTRDGHRLESVLLRIASGRTSLCLSTQVGCAAKCSFCATGQMSPVINLSAAEILDQVVLARQIASRENRRVRNLIFMGMGEPLHNEDNLYLALGELTSTTGFGFAPGRIVVSTVGIPGPMLRLAARYPKVRIALSLHSARQQVREQIIPIARRHPLAELRTVLQQIAQQSANRIMIEYLMLDGLTDTDEDGRALLNFVSGLPVHINLIPLNPIERPRIATGPTLAASSPQRTSDFANDLRRGGLPVTIRYSLGADVAAACGQLVQRRKRQVA